MKTLSRYVQEPNSTYSSHSVSNRIALRGVSGLSDAELLSVFIQPKSKEVSPLDLARNILTEVKSLDALVNLECEDFTKYTGLGKASFIKFKAAIEIDRRRLFVQATQTDVVTNPDVVKELISRELNGINDEIFGVVFLNNQNQVLESRQLFIGDLTSCNIFPRTVLRHCLMLEKCRAIIAYHQHGSDRSSEPSIQDIRFTKKLSDALEYISVQLLDHIITCRGSTTSMAERGFI